MLKQLRLNRPFHPDVGHAFIAQVPKDFLNLAGATTVGIVSEDDKALGPAEALHQHIRDIGGGAFSLWGSHVYFSASDNTDCNTNNRNYTLTIIDLSETVIQKLSSDDGLVLDILNRSSRRNNSFFLNYFGYYNAISAALHANRIEFPTTALELGTGAKPYTALRFLVEGVRRFVANDIIEVGRTFAVDDLRNMGALIELVQPGSGERLRTVLRTPDGRQSAVRGLEVYDRTAFEGIHIPGDFDLIFSISVLEHVMKPREVVEKMFSLLNPGGHAWHSIDLRDHRDFSKPLAFLEMTAEEYAAMNTENRLRASDWFTVFSEVGFELVDRQFVTLPPGFRCADDANFLYLRDLQVTPWVDQKMRAGFKAPFDNKDLPDLSTLAIHVLYRKPLATTDRDVL